MQIALRIEASFLFSLFLRVSVLLRTYLREETEILSQLEVVVSDAISFRIFSPKDKRSLFDPAKD